MSKKTPRYQMANWVVLFSFVLSALIIGCYLLSTKGIGVAWKGFVAVLYALIPFLIRRIFKLRPAYLMDMTLLIFIFLAYNLGVALELYGSLAYFDNVAHGLSGVVFAGIGLCIYYYLTEDKDKGMGYNRKASIAFSFCFAQLTAVVWELIEYAGFLFFGHDAQGIAAGVKDTMEDMFFCLIGSAVTCILMAVHLRGKHKIFLFAPVDEFYRVNFGRKKETKPAEAAPPAANPS